MVDSAAADRAAEKVRKLVAMSASPHLEEARTSAYLACRLIREHGLQVSGQPPSAASAPGVPTAGVPHRQPTADSHGFCRIRVRHPGHCRCCGKPIAPGE
ncbi:MULTISPECIES: DUF2786 domain-containing protein [unclassified Cyanobium]|uniref:DUF2786 domain-containing protein n=1 Tax=unclassified Cyanobium TaxID=2627006 RepID=UPI0020CD93E2|nr:MULTISPECIES: DUF2786 domain-containing protein [unclassified Cyanobium]MCP9859796.1 DUF2786 domain-containing protein [Cyanobium sp. Cruz-8H5]MCP9866930.1 DUF2786 domain-containing protein [Cyanobium sp. Cruz-8D1]